MIFQKRPRKSVDINFKIATEPIEIVQEYTYLGTRLTPTGNFTLAVEHLKEKALYAFASIRIYIVLISINCVPKLVWDFPRLCGLDTLIKFIIIIITKTNTSH